MVSVVALPLPALDQLTQITEKLLAAEEKKLKVLKAEIQASKQHSDKKEDAAKVSLHVMIKIRQKYSMYHPMMTSSNVRCLKAMRSI